MSQENVELVKRSIQAYNARDLDALRALSHPDVEYHGLADWPDRPLVFRGHEGIERFVTQTDDDFDEFRQEPQEFIDAGDRVVIVFEITAIGKQSRAPVRFTDAFVTTISDGLIARVQVCGTREKALEVAGLSE